MSLPSINTHNTPAELASRRAARLAATAHLQSRIDDLDALLATERARRLAIQRQRELTADAPECWA